MALFSVIKREWRRLCSRPIYMVGIAVVPVCFALFFLSLLSEGLPLRVPVAIVDLDHTTLSRHTARSLNAMELVDIVKREESFNEAMRSVQCGDIYGFFVIPANFEQNALAGNAPTLTFYNNLTYYVPGTLAFKGFKTLAVTTSGRVVQTDLVANGIPDNMASTFLQPMTVASHPLNNPWLNYNYYLATSFIPGLLELMIFIMTVYAITHEIKTGTATQWLHTANGDIWTAITGKLIPQTIMFTILAFGMVSLLFCWNHFPMNGELWHMLVAAFLFVVACQSFAVIACAAVPNMRLALSICSLCGILAFSLAAFSFPVQAMYGAMGIFSYILPVRYYFLIYIDEALNGIPLYFSRMNYVALLIFPILAMALAPLMKRQLVKPVYVQ